MPLAVFVDGREAPARERDTLFAYAASIDVHVPTSCFGQGKCRECLVEVEEGLELLSERTDEEGPLDERFRLSCRARVIGESGVVRCQTMRRGALRIEDDSIGLSTESYACVDAAVERVGSEVVRGGEVLATAFPATAPILGLAIDLGTTTVVLRLHDLESGRLLATSSFENPQRFGGTDVMARIRFDSENRGRLLQRTLIGYLAHAIEELPCDSERIFAVVVAGNTAMRDLFFGLDVRSVGEFPYHSSTQTKFESGVSATTSLTARPKQLHLPIHPSAEIYGMPLIGGHVGADAAAAMLATGIGTTDEVQVVMDIGTNTELIVGHRERLIAASCPAGPAFEGGAIRNGVPGLDGAIERVAIGASGSASVSVIGDGDPIGLCGSGLVDLLSELRRTGLMNERGRFEQGEADYVVDREHDIRLTEFDINELAQAKGANAAGLRAVFDLFGIEPQEIDRFYLAGGFGRHINVDAARRIGLVPDLPDERFVRVGNAALEGASMVLTSLSRRDEIERRVQSVEHVSLETHPNFFDYFVDGCQFTRFGGAG